MALNTKQLLDVYKTLMTSTPNLAGASSIMDLYNKAEDKRAFFDREFLTSSSIEGDYLKTADMRSKAATYTTSSAESAKKMTMADLEAFAAAIPSSKTEEPMLRGRKRIAEAMRREHQEKLVAAAKELRGANPDSVTLDEVAPEVPRGPEWGSW